jgi:hypothetical protein
LCLVCVWRGYFNNCSQTSEISSLGEECTLSFNLYPQFFDVYSLSHVVHNNHNTLKDVITSYLFRLQIFRDYTQLTRRGFWNFLKLEINYYNNSLLLWSSQRSKCSNQISTPRWQSIWITNLLKIFIFYFPQTNILLSCDGSRSFFNVFDLFVRCAFFSLFANFSFIHLFPPFSLDCKLIAVDPNSTSFISKLHLQLPQFQHLHQRWMFQRVLPNPTSHSIRLSFIITLLKTSFPLKKHLAMYIFISKRPFLSFSLRLCLFLFLTFWLFCT